MRLSKRLTVRCASILLLTVLLCSQAFAAAEPVQTPVDAKGGETAVDVVKPSGPKEVPVSQTNAVVDGKQTLTKVFEVSPDYDPEDLKEEGLQLEGYTYTLTSFTKEVFTKEDTDVVTEEKEITLTTTKADETMAEALKMLPAFLDYDKGGYEGRLYPMPNTLEIKETGRSSHSGTKTQTRTGTCEYNDDGLVPTTITVNGQTYSRSSLTWQEGAVGPDATIPENYQYTATYRKGYTYTTVDGYTAKMTYSGEVELEDDEMVRYTLVYTGHVPEENAPGSVIGKVLMWVVIVAVIAALAFAGYLLFRRRKGDVIAFFPKRNKEAAPIDPFDEEPKL